MTLRDILKTKTVSVWGVGYLGYTSMLALQQGGFDIVAYDLHRHQLEKMKGGDYPDKEQAAVWSRVNYLPKLDRDKIKIANSPAGLFRSSSIHIIAMSEFRETTKGDNMVKRMAAIFAANLRKGRTVPLVIFESTSVPGHIEENFVKPLAARGIRCSRDYYLGAIFRPDWTTEAFMNRKGKLPIAGHCLKGLAAVKRLTEYLGIRTIELDGIKEGEIYINSMNAIQVVVSDFLRQLVLGYPSVNIKKISERLFKNISFDDCAVNIGSGGEKETFAIDNLIRGSESQEALALLKEFQDSGISSVLSYAEYIVRHGYKSVAMLGITYKGNQKDVVLSPSLTLADYLLKNSVRVWLNDPFYSSKDIVKLVKGARAADFPDGVFDADVVVVSSDHNQYRYLSQERLDGIKKKTRLVIDNIGVWSHLKFDGGIYHQVGDGSLNLLK
ncbi:MAG: UDP binding domain-containing protein [Candidatus Omnitrophota bacterium]